MAVEKFKVCIQCLTYNQSVYITDALNGFVKQQTDFPYFALVVDDASNDGEQAVINSYLDENFERAAESGYKEWETKDANWVLTKHKENDNCFFVVVFLKRNLYRDPRKQELLDEWMARAKYIAMCEGDDYWTDPYKLQKQVDFLENHGDYVACFHNARVLYNDHVALFNGLEENHHPTTEDIIKRLWFIATPSLLYRNIIKDMPEWSKEIVNGDYLLELLLAKEGKFYYMDDVMTVYRKHGTGMSAVLNKNKVDMVDKLIYLLSKMKLYYGGEYSSAFDESINNYKEIRAAHIKEAYYDSHPFARMLRPKTYKRIIKKRLKKLLK